MRDFNPRKMMEKAVQVMSDSIPEPRDDGKASPKVGAVLVDLSDELRRHDPIMTAYRGELRHGDHAEYTLLERKNRDRKLDNCILFATLEPCAPDARKPPKISCAERIVLARIKRVWVGIEDPDPTVDRKGIKYLQDHDVDVQMFDRDLQEIIRQENQAFIEQALERAVAAKKKPKEAVLWQLESVPAHAQIEELSTPALAEYRERAKITEAVDTVEFRRRLMRQNLLKSDGKRFVPTGFGNLLFGKEPRTAMPQAGLLATIHYPDGTEETRDFEGPHVFVPQELLRWLTDKLPNAIDRSHAIREKTSKVFFELIREGVVNALVHRDYGIEGAKCQLIVSPDKIEIRSPGQPVLPITLEQMQRFDAPMLSRNPILHYVFAKMELAEERGLGLKSMREKAIAAGLPLPRYAWDDPYLVLSLFPSPSASRTALPKDTLNKLGKKELAGWQWLSTKGRTKTADYAKAKAVDARTARRHLNRFVELGLVRTIGAGPATEYEVT